MVIIATKSGRLGNRLFLFAHFVAWAIEHKQKIANISMEEYAEYFVHLRSDLFCRYPPRNSGRPRGRVPRRLLYLMWLFVRPGRSRLARELGPADPSLTPARIAKGLVVRAAHFLRPLIERLWSAAKARHLVEFIKLGQDESYVLDHSLVRIADGHRLVFAEGWLFRNERLVLAHREKIRDFLMPIPAVRAKVQAVIAEARSDCDVLVGIHVRRGDYRQFRSGKYFFTDDQYRHLMKQIREQLADKRVRFLICSDEPLRPETFDEFDVTLGPGHLMEDLYSLAECDFIVGPPSTFSLWASFAGNVPLKLIQDPEESLAIEGLQNYVVRTTRRLSQSASTTFSN